MIDFLSDSEICGQYRVKIRTNVRFCSAQTSTDYLQFNVHIDSNVRTRKSNQQNQNCSADTYRRGLEFTDNNNVI